MITQDAASFLENSKEYLLLDIRPEVNFMKGHLPHAVNIPFPIQLKKIRQQYAKGVEIEALGQFVENEAEWQAELKSLFLSKEACFIYCQSGGLRSFYFHRLTEQYQIPFYYLDGGYDAYCKYQIQYFQQFSFSKLIVLSGKTGSGKTATIQRLGEEGKQVINLSALAKHRGSVFGHILGETQPTTAQFQHNLLEICGKLNPEKSIFIEAEGPYIGSVTIPEVLYVAMQRADGIEVGIPMPARVDYLVAQYADLPTNTILQALEKIKRRLAPRDYEGAKGHILEGRKQAFVTLIIDYYDQSTIYGSYGTERTKSLHFSKVDSGEIARKICEEYP